MRLRWAIVIGWAVAFLGPLDGGCARPGAVEAALHGDLKTLQERIRESQEGGEMDRETVVALARAVASREVRASRGPAAVRRLRQLQACVPPLAHVLQERAGRLDEAGAEAALLLFESGRLDADALVDRYHDATDGAWRAVAARATVNPPHAELRRAFIVDHDQRVRRAALRAALATPNLEDVDPVLEAVRLDPDPLARSLAARAAGALGGRGVTLALRDYWARADEQTRMMIIEAWAMPASFRDGGREALSWVAETQGGLPAVAAADALVRAGDEGLSVGTAVLVRALRDGTRSERRLALRLAPLADSDVRAELRKASQSRDPRVCVMALARLVGQPGERSSYLDPLRKLAQGKGDVAVQARAALAAAGDTNVVEPLRQQVRAAGSDRRRIAALALLRLGLHSEAATALGDDDPRVRTAVACSILAESTAR